MGLDIFRLQSSNNLRARLRGFVFSVLGMLLPLLLLATFLISTSHQTLEAMLGPDLVAALGSYLVGWFSAFIRLV